MTAAKDCAADILHTDGFMAGIDPIGMNFIRTFSATMGRGTVCSVGVCTTCSLAELTELSSLSASPICDNRRE